MKLIQTLLLLFLTLSLFAQGSKIEIFPEDHKEFSKKIIIENLILEGVDVLEIKSKKQQYLLLF